jgi:hypothetical protein
MQFSDNIIYSKTLQVHFTYKQLPEQTEVRVHVGSGQAVTGLDFSSCTEAATLTHNIMFRKNSYLL